MEAEGEMYILHVDIIVQEHLSDDLQTNYRGVFCPALARQPGFVETQLLRAHSSTDRTHRIVVAFDSEASQQAWVASKLYEQVSKELKARIAKFSSADSFDLAWGVR